MGSVYVVIMAGGVGSRFWPKSRQEHPKQFLDILGTGQSLLQQTVNRFAKVCKKENILIVTSENYVKLVKKQLPGIKPNQILAEPSRKNTAPCISYAAHKIFAMDEDATMVVSPSDHVILQNDKFIRIIKDSVKTTKQNDILVTLGIRPTRPDIGYGYIQYMKTLKISTGFNKKRHIYKVKTFTEKPSLDLAKTFLKSGDFLWNSGMFVWNVRSILSAFQKYLPEVYDAFNAGKKIYNTPKEKDFLSGAYDVCPKISIDYGIMEKADNVYVVPAAFGWSDLGTWTSLYEKLRKDGQGNVIQGTAITYNTKKSIVMIPEGKLAVLKGLENFIVVETEDILLVCPKEDEQDIKGILSDLKRRKKNKYL